MQVFVRRSLALLGTVVLLGLIGGGSTARAEILVALGRTNTVENALVTIDSNSLGASGNVLSISGVAGTLVDIDYRPATGQLYGLGSTGALYTINTATGAATAVTTGFTNVTDGSGVFLTGNQFTIDFNPTVDRLRVLSNTGQNLRVNVTNGVTNVDGQLNFGPNQPAPGVVGAAYTNSFAGATTTTLYDLRYSNDAFSLYTQTPPNDGRLVLTGAATSGITSLSSMVGFDISGATGTAYVLTNSQDMSNIATNNVIFNTINLATGTASTGVAISGLPTGFQVRGLAAPLGASAVPEPASLALVGLGLAGVGALARRRSAQS